MSKKVFVVTGPSGVGKTYLLEQLSARYPGSFMSSKLLTTRKPRANEQGSDRVFVTADAFKAEKSAGNLPIVGTFHGNQYGYTKDVINPLGKHVLVNTWPAMLPSFAELNDVTIVALTIDRQTLPLLVKRMESRGESPKVMAERTALIMRDIEDIERHKTIINKHGRCFTIVDDTTIPELVIPWILTF